MDLARAVIPLRVMLRVAIAVVILVALLVDVWVVDGYSGRQSLAVVVAIAALGVAWVRWPKAVLALAITAAVVSLVGTTEGRYEGLGVAVFTEFVVLPMMFAAVLASNGSARWPVAVLLVVAAESVSLRADDPALRAIIAIAMLVLLGAGTTAVVYMRLRDSERRIGIEHARQNERLELARELHDVVGHHVTGIVVLAQASRFTGGAESDSPAGRALVEIEVAGLETLTSVRRLIGLLRTEPSTSAVPRLADVERVVENLRTTHPSTDLVIDDDVRARWVPPDLANTVLRLVQEAATNVRRHGDPSALTRFTLHRRNHVFELTIENRMLNAPSSDGYGIIGMRERVDALGGTLWAGDTGNGRWVVRAELPMLNQAGADAR